MIESLEDFLEACRGKARPAIHSIFEDGIDDCTYVHIMANLDNEEDPDPERNALNALGKKHSIESLINY